jgi:peptide/nickel transport system permease protein
MPKLAKSSAVYGTPDQPLKRLWKVITKDKIVLVSFVALVILYLMVALAPFLSPYSAGWYRRDIATGPITPVYMVDAETHQITWPYVFKVEKSFDPNTFEYGFKPDSSKAYPLQFFTHGEPYELLWGLIESDIHLVGVSEPATLNVLGTDMNGRDNFSRLLFGGRVSLTIGFLSLFIVFPIGLLYGGISGYFGGWLDNLLMRVAEVVMSIPTLYLLLSLAAILPPGLSSTDRFIMVTLILAFTGWAGLSRTIRGMILTLKNAEYVEAARAVGMGSFSIILKHLLPQTASFVVVAITLGVPGYILAESGLSFLGLGILQPDASWGNMLKEAQEITNIVDRPWMLMPGFLIFIAVLAFNVIGDAVRDELDPKNALRRS